MIAGFAIATAVRRNRRRSFVRRHFRNQRPQTLDARLHVQQHPSHIRVLDDRHRGIRIFEVLDRAALLPLPRIAQCVKVRRRSHSQALNADANARKVHHVEHLLHALVFARRTADHFAWAGAVFPKFSTAVAEAGCPSCAPGPHRHVVRFAKRPIGIYPHLGHDEQRQTFGPCRRIFRPRQHQMDDVFRSGRDRPTK